MSLHVLHRRTDADKAREAAPAAHGVADTAPSADAPARDLSCDVCIVGCGVGGLYTALNLPSDLDVLMLSKESLDECDSMLAQGGICVLRDEDDYDAFFEDTLRAGHYENRRESVDIMIRSSRPVIDDLIARGVEFARDDAGALAYTREGSHSRARICFHGDTTGAEVTTKLRACVRALPNVRIVEHVRATDLICAEDDHGADRREACAGVVAVDARGTLSGTPGAVVRIHAAHTVLATGGVGGTYAHSTNYPCLTGDGCEMARRAGVMLEHMDYVQIHPTTLFTRTPGRAFLISESCRGEGAVLLDAHGQRFTDELAPRDVVSAAIFEQMQLDGTDHVMLSFASVPDETIRTHFAHIYARCLEEGFDLTRESVPVVPAQHYFMGGIHVDSDSRTTMQRLFAVGETSCNGVHGKNRLASNSLLESLVFARRAARAIVRERTANANVAGSEAARRTRIAPLAHARTSAHAAPVSPGPAPASAAAPAAAAVSAAPAAPSAVPAVARA